MTLKSLITALLVLCAAIFAQTGAPVAPADSAYVPLADADEDSDDEDVPEPPADVDFEVSTTPLVKGKTGILAIDTLPVNEWDIPTKRNSLKYAMLFSLLPGVASITRNTMSVVDF